MMSEVDSQHKSLYLDFVTRNSDGGANNLIGNKHFWRSDMMVHRAKNWYASVRMCSNRTVGGESSNSENLRGYFAADGVLLPYVTGREYESIFPVWDWRRLPGLTCLQAGDPPAMPRRLQGTTDFVGGVSDGKTGVSALDFDRDGVAAHKSWFFLEDAIVCMGAGIRSNEAHPVVTSINQCRLQGDVKEGPNWYWHDSIGYHVPSKQKVKCERGPQSGSWSQLTDAQWDGVADEVEMDVFSLWIEHGTQPQNESYSYAIHPGITADEMASKAKEEKITILKNTQDTQALYDTTKKRHMIAFWKAGGIKLNNNKALKTDSPCLVMLEEMGDAPLLRITEPTQKLEAINIDLTGFKPLSVKLPAAPHRGDTVEARLSPL
jgi:chondroitin AC lyase